MKNVKTCVSCKHCILGYDSFSLPECGHPDCSKTDPVTGKVSHDVCHLQRATSGIYALRLNLCGVKGRKWEPKEVPTK